MNSRANKTGRCFNLIHEKTLRIKRFFLLSALSLLFSLITMLVLGFDPVNVDNWPHPLISHSSEPTFRDIESLLAVFPKTITAPRFFSVFYPRPLAIDGTGENIAVIEASKDYNPLGLIEFDRIFNLPDPVVWAIPVGSPPESWDSGETMLDVELIHMLAPKAQIYLLQWDGKSPQITREIVNVEPNAISASIGIYSRFGITLLRTPFLPQARNWDILERYNSFVATGDFGAGVDFPSAMENVVSVGGTQFSPFSSMDYDHLYGWPSSTGGLAFFARPRPAWQVGNQSIWRGVPDVSFLSGWPGYAVCLNAHQWTVMNGTSAAAPVVSAAWALGDELYFNKHGQHLPTMANQIIYDLYRQQPGIFSQAIGGGNGEYKVATGWNAVTGLGCPRLDDFVTALGNYKASKMKETSVFSIYLWDAIDALAFLLAILILALCLSAFKLERRPSIIKEHIIANTILFALAAAQILIGVVYGVAFVFAPKILWYYIFLSTAYTATIYTSWVLWQAALTYANETLNPQT